MTRSDVVPAVVDEHPFARDLVALKPQMAELGIDPARFRRTVLNEVTANPDLLGCTPQSLVAAVLASAQLDLEPGGRLGLSWLIPRTVKGTKVVTWQLGYRGMVELARRAGVTVTVGSVGRNDTFRVTQGLHPDLVHEPDAENPGEFYLWYAVADMGDGRKVFRVLNREQVEERRAGSNSDAWKRWFDAMARKTAIRALWSVLPMSPTMQHATAIDDQVLTLPAVRADVTTLVDVEVLDTIREVAGAADVDDGVLLRRAGQLYGVEDLRDLTATQADDLLGRLQEVAP